jgi:predicted Holliday junction resolvase-like endonuclease
MIVVVLLVMILIEYFRSERLDKKLKTAQEQYITLLSQKKSSETRLGQITEQMAPFLKDFPYDPKQAHFLGMPVDYVVFTETDVVFLEVKSGQAALSQRQKQIKDQILNKRVLWKEYRVSGQVQNTQPVLGETSSDDRPKNGKTEVRIVRQDIRPPATEIVKKLGA